MMSGVIAEDARLAKIQTEKIEAEKIVEAWNDSSKMDATKINKSSLLHLEQIPLSIHHHRGHFHSTFGSQEEREQYHPRNLLDNKGIATVYESSDGIKQGTNDGDWIIFEIESAFQVIPKAIVLRNWTYTYGTGIKSIELSMSVDGKDFEMLTVIKDIQNTSSKEQCWILEDLMLSDAKMYENKYKFIMLKVCEFYPGFGGNKFHSFAIFGMTLSLKPIPGQLN